MSLRDDLAKATRAPRNPVDAALAKVGPDDATLWKEALFSGEYTQSSLAEILSKHSGIEVRRQQVADWKRSNI